MRILLSYYSRKGYTERLARTIERELESRGHRIEVETIIPIGMASNWFILMSQCMPGVPHLLFSCFIKRTNRYHQPEAAIEPPRHLDVSGYDRVIIGGPKWVRLAFPVARYIKSIEGLRGKKVAGFTTFCGPPLTNFEIYAYFMPFNHIVRESGGEVIAQLGISSAYTDILLLPKPWFKMLARTIFQKRLSDFTLDSEWGRQQTEWFCDLIEREEVSTRELLIP